MEKKNYYAILGVSRMESITGIRSAFRKLAKVHHPDLSGPEETRRFQKITEAYCVLSNPESRECYDKSLNEEEAREKRRVVRQSSTEPVFRRDLGIPLRRSRGRMGGPSISDIFDDLFSDFSRGLRRKSIQSLHEIEVILSADEALQGIVLPLTIPLRIRCPACGGSGERMHFACIHCHGRGALKVHKSIRINISPNVEDGSVLEVPIQNTGTDAQLLRMHIRVES